MRLSTEIKVSDLVLVYKWIFIRVWWERCFTHLSVHLPYKVWVQVKTSNTVTKIDLGTPVHSKVISS